MPSYASEDELAVWMGLAPFDEAQTARATLLLDVATGVIDDETGQHLSAGVTTDQWDYGTGTTKLVLSRWPVTAVASVTVDGELLVVDQDYTWESAGILTRTCGVWECDEDISTVFTAGYATIPSSVKGMCLELAAGSWNAFGGKKSERIGDYSVAYLRAGMTLSTSDKKALGRYSANR